MREKLQVNHRTSQKREFGGTYRIQTCIVGLWEGLQEVIVYSALGAARKWGEGQLNVWVS